MIEKVKEVIYKKKQKIQGIIKIYQLNILSFDLKFLLYLNLYELFIIIFISFLIL